MHQPHDPFIASLRLRESRQARLLLLHRRRQEHRKASFLWWELLPVAEGNSQARTRLVAAVGRFPCSRCQHRRFTYWGNTPAYSVSDEVGWWSLICGGCVLSTDRPYPASREDVLGQLGLSVTCHRGSFEPDPHVLVSGRGVRLAELAL